MLLTGDFEGGEILEINNEMNEKNSVNVFRVRCIWSTFYQSSVSLFDKSADLCFLSQENGEKIRGIFPEVPVVLHSIHTQRRLEAKRFSSM